MRIVAGVLLAVGLRAWAAPNWVQHCEQARQAPDIASDAAAVLGWERQSGRICQGAFRPLKPHKDVGAQWHLATDRSVWMNKTGLSYWQGPVSVAWGKRRFRAREMCVWTAKAPGQVSRLRVQGGARYEHDGLLVHAKRLEAQLDQRQVHGESVLWRWRNPKQGRSWWGKAQRLDETADVVALAGGQLSACGVDSPAWWLQVNHLELSRQTGWARARHVWMKVGGVPVFYWPYWQFPVDGKRHTGLLVPRVSATHTSGLEVAMPWYWNIMKPMDMMWVPRWSSKRGLGLDVTWRYLQRMGLQSFTLWQQWRDRAFEAWRVGQGLSQGHHHRWAWVWQHHWAWSTGIQSQALWQQLSDAYWLRDFPKRGGELEGPYLPHWWQLSWEGKRQHLTLQALGFQVIHPVDQPVVSEIFQRLPVVNWHGFVPLGTSGLQVEGDVEWLRFIKTGPVDFSGHRLRAHPGWRWRHVGRLGDLEVYQRWHWLAMDWSGHPERVTASVPEWGVDWRGYAWRMSSDKQWLMRWQPRLFYAWIPYRSIWQQLPRIDDSQPRWSMDRLFVANRFVGGDRVGDTQRLVLGLGHRWQELGRDQRRLQLRLGQGYDFHQPKLGLNGPWQSESQRSYARWLPLVLEGAVGIPSRLHARVSAAYDWSGRRIYQLQSALRVPEVAGSMRPYGELGYVVDRGAEPESLHQLSLTLHQRWYAGWSFESALRYNLTHARFDHGSWGVLYQACCWSMGLVHARDALAQGGYRQGFFLRWSFSGLGSVGHLPMS